MSNTLTTINLVVRNGEKYIRQCLDSVLAQTYDHSLIELNILDNDSNDSTRNIIESYKLEARSYKLPKFTFTESKVNLGMWPGQEELLKTSNGKYIIGLSVDIILDPKFVEESVRVMEQNPKVGMLQAKIFQYELSKLNVGGGKWRERSGEKEPLFTSHSLPSKIIDTVGFKMFKSREVNNICHGLSVATSFAQGLGRSKKAMESKEEIGFDIDKQQEIFAVEGAVSVFRREAIEQTKITVSKLRSALENKHMHKTQSIDKGFISVDEKEFCDHEFFWYGDDLDFAWRMRLFGWGQLYAPSVIAHHDRQTTKSLGGGDAEFVKLRQAIPMFKRRLDYRNYMLTLIKNDYVSNVFRDLPYILIRQFKLMVYFFVYEPEIFREFITIAKLLPRMLLKRREIMCRVKVSASEIHAWFN